MALYVYLKKDNSAKRKAVSYLSYISLTIGALLLFWSFYPILSFEVYSRIFMKNNVQSPVPKSTTTRSLEQGSSVLGTNSVFSNNLRDFTDVKLWFPSTSQTKNKTNFAIKEYKLSIPKININDAKVVVNGEDLSKSLVQFLAQSLPGEYGNIIIFGHSTLPQLYNPKDYKTIFTYLPSLDRKDNIYLKVGDVSYEYKIYDMFVVDPDEVSVLEQNSSASYLTLITCVPPGTYWKRLVIKAKLTKLPVE